jgi:hypothetical protein
MLSHFTAAGAREIVADRDLIRPFVTNKPFMQPACETWHKCRIARRAVAEQQE